MKALGKRFTRSGHLDRHSRIHSGEKPYKCHMCDNAFSQSGSLNVHMRIHTGDKPYKCSLCNKSFRDSGNLQTHKRHVHSNIRNICWSHTMKALGWHVTCVRRNSCRVVTLRHAYVDMKVWSRMFAVIVRNVSIHKVNWKVIGWYTQTTNSFVVVRVVNYSNVKRMSSLTWRDVINLDLLSSRVRQIMKYVDHNVTAVWSLLALLKAVYMLIFLHQRYSQNFFHGASINLKHWHIGAQWGALCPSNYAKMHFRSVLHPRPC